MTKSLPAGIFWDEVQREWRARVVAEYHSAAFTAELLHNLLQLGAPYDLLYTAHRIVKDEMIHAERSFALYTLFGGEESAIALREETLVLPRYAAAVFDQVSCVAMHSFCLGETFAVPLFRAMSRGTTHPRAKLLLRRILTDESTHREFGWDLLDFLCETKAERVRELALEHVPRFLDEFAQGYGTLYEGEERVREAERAYGLMPRAEYVAVFRETVEQVILPRFAKRGIDLSSRWSLPENATRPTL
jgi:hypothetical protein